MADKDDKSPAPEYVNISPNKEKRVSLSDPKFLKDGLEYEPTEKDKLQGDEEAAGGVPLANLRVSTDPFLDADPSLTVEGQVVFMTSSKRDLSKVDSLRKMSSVSNKALGWKRYLGLVYTLLSTNMFSLSSNLLKLLGHVNPLNLGCFAFPMGALLSVPFIWYTLKIEKKPVMQNLLPMNEHKKVIFYMWVST